MSVVVVVLFIVATPVSSSFRHNTINCCSQEHSIHVVFGGNGRRGWVEVQMFQLMNIVSGQLSDLEQWLDVFSSQLVHMRKDIDTIEMRNNRQAPSGRLDPCNRF